MKKTLWLSGYVFPPIFALFLGMILVQGFKWPGFFQKHFGISLQLILPFVLASWFISLYIIKQFKKVNPLYSGLVFAAWQVFPILVFVSVFLLFTYNNNDLYYAVLDRWFFHWHWFSQAVWIITVLMGTLIYSFFSYSGQNYLEELKGKNFLSVKPQDGMIGLQIIDLVGIYFKPKYFIFIFWFVATFIFFINTSLKDTFGVQVVISSSLLVVFSSLFLSTNK